jgi:hypothetical protein
LNTAPNWKPAPALRNEAWLAYVRTLPSVQSGKRGCVAHHPVGHGRLSTLRVSDYFAIALTDSEHKVLHDGGWSAWEDKYGDQYDHALQTMQRGIHEGVLVWRDGANLGHWTETAQELERAIREGELVFCKKAARLAG